MKHLMLMSALSLAIVAGGAAESFAASGHGKGPKHSFEDLDANGDGLLTQSEMDGHMQARFASVDTDGNGVLSKGELEARGKAKSSARVAKMLDRLDANNDGGVSFEEMRAGRGGKLFERADADGDGAISQAEFDDIRSKARSRGVNAE